STSQLKKLEALLRTADDGAPSVVPLFADLLSINVGNHYPVSPLRSEALKDATLKALIAHLFSLSKDEALVVIVEDAHWIDPTTKELLDLLLADIARRPILVVVTYRPEHRPQWSGLPNALTLPVVHLPRAEVVQMIDGMLGGKPLVKDVLDQIIKKTDGVPLFIEELTKTIVEGGQIVETDDSYVLRDSVAELAIPTTIRDSLMTRLDAAASMREVAQVGACICRTLTRDVLAAVLALDDRAINDTLRQLKAAELVFPISA